MGALSDLGPVYWVGLAVVTALLAWPHVDIARRGVGRVGMGFMTVNGAVGLLYGAVVIVATLLVVTTGPTRGARRASSGYPMWYNAARRSVEHPALAVSMDAPVTTTCTLRGMRSE